MKHILLTISLIFGATAVSANTKVWAYNLTELRVPMLYLDTDELWHIPFSDGTWNVYKDIEKCRAQLQTYVLTATANSKVELTSNRTLTPFNPSATLYNSTDGIVHFVECSPKILQD